MKDLLAALGLVFVLEGAFLALFPLKWKNFVSTALQMPLNNLRLAGVSGAIIGFIIVGLARGF